MKKRVLEDIKLEADVPNGIIYHWMTPEQKERALSDWVKDFHSFIRDHRSQDPVSLSVVPNYVEVCSFCGGEWDVDENNVPRCCEKAQEEYHAERQRAEHQSTGN